jgi:hypothetical protein
MNIKKTKKGDLTLTDLIILPAFAYDSGQREVLQVWRKDARCVIIVDPERGEITFRENLLHLLGLDSSK